MKIQKQNDLFPPILDLLNDGQLRTKNEVVQALSIKLNLDKEYLEKTYPNNTQKVFDTTVYWKLNDLEKSGLLEFFKQGNQRQFYISDIGRSYVGKSTDDVVKFIRENYYSKFKKAKSSETKISVPKPLTESPEIDEIEQISNIHANIQQKIYNEILDTILLKTPTAFEHLVVKLLQKMGYGDWGRVTKASRDGGIDGEIKEDVLGFGRIYIQAKRYQKDAVIGRQTVQSFVGAVLGLGGNSNKGVFITTARFSQDAIEEVNNHPLARIVLIDGLKLAEYIYHYELGIQIEQTFSIKKLDADFWDEMPNEHITNS